MRRGELLRKLEQGGLPEYLEPVYGKDAPSAAYRLRELVLEYGETFPCDDEAELLDAALAARPRKVVIKRPPKGPWLAGAKPSHSLSGKAVRYDVIVVPRAG